jgi:hypothetical protein
MVKTRRRVNKRKTQRLWKMHGCSRTKRSVKYGCQKGGYKCGLQMGGNKCGLQMGGCNTCGLQKGGSMQLSPSPFVNKPWTPLIQSLPEVQGSGTGNWLTKNPLTTDVTDRTAIQERAGQIFPLQMGGKRKRKGKKTKRSKNSKRGGTGLGQLFGYGVNSAYSNLIGSPNMPVNPLPTAQFIQQ